MKRWIGIAVAMVAAAQVSWAGEQMGSMTLQNLRHSIMDEDVEVFRAEEFQTDIFGVLAIPTKDGNPDELGGGGGLGVNYYFTRYFGLGLDTYWFSNQNGVDQGLNLSILARLPIDSLRLAPYFTGGGGGILYQPEWSAHAGLGVEYRFTEMVGAFAEGRYHWTGDGEHVLTKVGVRYVF